MPSDASAVPAYLDAVRAGMVGHWTGIVSTPWSAPERVYLALEADGHYASRAVGGVPAFYYGTDFDTALKQWRLDSANVWGVVHGTIDIAFQYGPDFGLPVWQGELEWVKLDATTNRLAFQFYRSDADNGTGIQFDLWRCP